MMALFKNILLFMPRMLIRLYYKINKDAWRIKNWKLQGCPPPPPPVIKFRTLRSFQKKYRCPVFIETGTYRGDMVHRMRRHFKSLQTIELDKDLHRYASSRFSPVKKITCHQGDSSVVLREIMPAIRERCLFWLDGHYSGGETAKGELSTPVLAEVNIILRHIASTGLQHIILIDDARCFDGTEDYPPADVLLKLIDENLANYRHEIINDIICVFPHPS
jgi:hypothetical protein